MHTCIKVPGTGPLFLNRHQAGGILANALWDLRQHPNTVVLGLPRGGMPVAAVVAARLELPLDVFVIRKLGVPGNKELAMGAIAQGGIRVVNEEVFRHVTHPRETLDRVAAIEQRELERREKTYRRNKPPLELKGLGVVLVDDGLATGASMRAAVQAVQALGAAFCVPAAPVGSLQAWEQLQSITGHAVCVYLPLHFEGVARFYRNFDQVSDEEVLLALATGNPAGAQ